MKYNMIVDIDGGKLIFNELTRAIIFMSNEEFNDVFNVDRFEYLYRNYFIVPEDFNEMEVTDRIRKQFQKEIDDLYLTKVSAYNILTTTKCNARCFYCYELKTHKEHMTEQTARDIVEYISKHSPIDQPISLRWFGGEPLFNMKVIDIITSGLRDRGYKFFSNFTTNGYLFDDFVITKAINSWGLRSCQITIDGTEKVYNKAKNYIYKTGSPYQRVIKNIALLLSRGVQVTVRMNCDSYNIEDLKLLSRELYDRFGSSKNLNAYVYPIFENDNFQRTEEEKAKVFSGVMEIEDVLQSLGYLHGASPDYKIKDHQCMADSGGVISISPKGELGTCEHYVDSDFWGDIHSDKKDMSILEGWQVYEPPIDLCSNCPNYPSCIRPTKCEEMRKCDKYYQKWYVRKAKIGLVNWYKKQNNGRNNAAK